MIAVEIVRPDVGTIMGADAWGTDYPARFQCQREAMRWSLTTYHAIWEPSGYWKGDVYDLLDEDTLKVVRRICFEV